MRSKTEEFRKAVADIASRCARDFVKETQDRYIDREKIATLMEISAKGLYALAVYDRIPPSRSDSLCEDFAAAGMIYTSQAMLCLEESNALQPSSDSNEDKRRRERKAQYIDFIQTNMDKAIAAIEALAAYRGAQGDLKMSVAHDTTVTAPKLNMPKA